MDTLWGGKGFAASVFSGLFAEPSQRCIFPVKIHVPAV
jgi:hypothetical protein